MKPKTCSSYTILFLLLILHLIGLELSAQHTELPARAIINVNIHFSDGSVIDRASIVWRGGVIEAVGQNISIPFDARVIDGGDSLHVYPGFINGFATWGTPERERFRTPAPIPGFPEYARAGIQPHRHPVQLIEDKPIFKEALKNGFSAANIGLSGYMLPGQIAHFAISDSDIKNGLLGTPLGQSFQFEFVQGAYPSTLMGVMARLRQLFFDAEAYNNHHSLFASNTAQGIAVPSRDDVLEAFTPIKNKEIPLFAFANNQADILRMFRLQDEIGFNMVLVGATQAAPIVSEIKRRGIPVLVQLELPKKPDWMKEAKSEKDEEETLEIEALSVEVANFRARQAEEYESRMNNIRTLLDAGITVGATWNGTRFNEFHNVINALYEHGYSHTELLAMLTINSARATGLSRLGDLKPGMIANIAVFTDKAFSKGTKVLYTVSAGKIYNTENLD